MKKRFLLYVTAFFVFSMHVKPLLKAGKIIQHNLGETVILYHEETCGNTRTVVEVQKMNTTERTVYSGYKLIFEHDGLGQEILLLEQEAQQEWKKLEEQCTIQPKKYGQ